MKSPIEISLNDYVTVYLTDSGWNFLRMQLHKRYDEINLDVEEYLEDKMTSDNGIKGQMWEIVSLLSPVFYNGSNYLKTTTIVVEK